MFYFIRRTYLDAYSKKWRLYADTLNDAAMCIEIALPLFKSYITFALCVSTVMKAIVGVAGTVIVIIVFILTKMNVIVGCPIVLWLVSLKAISNCYKYLITIDPIQRRGSCPVVEDLIDIFMFLCNQFITTTILVHSCHRNSFVPV